MEQLDHELNTYHSISPYIQLVVPLKNGPDYTLSVYHIIKGPDPSLFPEFKRTRRVESLLLEGSPSTLFTYEITGLNQEGINQLNSLDPYDISGRLKKLNELQANVQFHSMKNKMFDGNLEIIDFQLKIILATCLYYFYKDNINRCEQLIKKIWTLDTLSLSPKTLYIINKKKFLVALIFGLKPDIRWDGHHHAPDAYQVTHPTGDQFIFHLSDKYNFHKKILANTRFDYVDPVKVGFGNIYSKDNKNLIDLCLQVSLI